jgi:alanine-synthesizing transaminase
MLPPPPLSRRLPADLTPSVLHAELVAGQNAAPLDLMQSNPTCCGFDYPEVPAVLLGPDTWTYAPEPFGLPMARRALAAYLTARGAIVSADDLVLTASTSEAYSTLFKLLCNPGDAVATAVPGYPLVTHLAELDAVRTVTYRWAWTPTGWRLDMDSVTAALAQPQVRALVVIAPSSPVGATLREADYAALSRACTAAGAVLIVDAVFAPYQACENADVDPAFAAMPAVCQSAGCTIVLSGLSKAAGLPQLKLGWMSLHGDTNWRDTLRAGLEWISDAYLSVSTPVQVALPSLLDCLDAMQRQIRRRLAVNRRALAAALDPVAAVQMLPADAGWYAVVQGPANADEDAWVRHLRRTAQVSVHPGYFYDFEQNGIWVVGLLLPPEVFAAAAARVATALQQPP